MQIWRVSYPAGNLSRITNDSNDYSFFSLTADASTLVTTQESGHGEIWVASSEMPEQGKRVTVVSGSKYELMGGVDWTPEGNIVFASTESGNCDIWSMHRDGSKKTQITSDISVDYLPRVSPKGKYILFYSNRAGFQDLWCFSMDDRRLKQLTSNSIANGGDFTPDGESIMFSLASVLNPDSSVSSVTYKIPMAGGEPVKVWQDKSRPYFSPDGSKIAFTFWDDSTKAWLRAVMPFDETTPKTKIVSYLPYDPLDIAVRWSPDSQAMIFSKTESGVTNLWRQPLDGSSPEQITHFTEGEIWAFAYSHDGKYFAYTRGRTDSDAVMISNFR